MAIDTQKGQKVKFEILINEGWCKGCEICVAFCPKKVLIMERDKAKVANPENCTGCLLCELYCPDFAIKVERKGENGRIGK